MTDLLLQPTGTPHPVRSDRGRENRGRIALSCAPRNRSKPWVWSIDLAFSPGHDPVHGFAATQEAAISRKSDSTLSYGYLN